MKSITGLGLEVIEYLFIQNEGKRVFPLERIKEEFKEKPETMMVDVLSNLEEEGFFHFKNGFLKKNVNKTKEFEKFAEAYKQVKTLPSFSSSFYYAGSPELVIYAPFQDRFRNSNLRLTLKEDNGDIYLSLPPVINDLNYLTEEYIEELKWRFEIKIESKHMVENYSLWKFEKETTKESLINDLYSFINAVLFIEGYLAKDVFKKITKEDLVETIVNLELQTNYCCMDIPENYEKNRKKELEKKNEPELWNILEQEAMEYIPEVEEEVDSMALSAYRDALMLLARKGLFEIRYKSGRRVIGKWRN